MTDIAAHVYYRYSMIMRGDKGNGDFLKEDVSVLGDFSWNFIKEDTINGFFMHTLEKACCVPRQGHVVVIKNGMKEVKASLWILFLSI